MYGKKSLEENETKLKEPKRLLIPIFILVAAIIILGLYPTIVFNLINPAIKQFQFTP
jgi:NADH:ubiquinone oxidoreductase subunit 4 (subunit M)